MKYLLTLLLVIGMMAPAYAAVDPYKGTAEEVQSANYYVEKVHGSKLSEEEKFSAISENFVNEVRRRKIAENFVDWLIDGISRALDASPLKVRDSLPPDIENADIPEYLVHQLLNMDAMRRAQNEVVGAKPSPILNVSIKLTQEELRRLSSRDDMINLILNNESRLFFQVEK